MRLRVGSYYSIAGNIPRVTGHIGLLWEKPSGNSCKLLVRDSVEPELVDVFPPLLHPFNSHGYHPSVIDHEVEQLKKERRMIAYTLTGLFGYKRQKEANNQETWERYDRLWGWICEQQVFARELREYYWLKEAEEDLRAKELARAQAFFNQPPTTQFGDQMSLFNL